MIGINTNRCSRILSCAQDLHGKDCTSLVVFLYLLIPDRLPSGYPGCANGACHLILTNSLHPCFLERKIAFKSQNLTFLNCFIEKHHQT